MRARPIQQTFASLHPNFFLCFHHELHICATCRDRQSACTCMENDDKKFKFHNSEDHLRPITSLHPTFCVIETASCCRLPSETCSHSSRPSRPPDILVQALEKVNKIELKSQLISSKKYYRAFSLRGRYNC